MKDDGWTMDGRPWTVCPSLSTVHGPWSTVYARITSTPPIQGMQHFRYHDGAICLLVIFHHGDQRARHTQARTIQRMDEARLAAIGGTVFDIGPAGLEIGIVRDR